MNIEDVLKIKGKKVITIHIDAVVADALRLMQENRIGALIVVDDRGKITGILSERDIIYHLYNSQTNIKGKPVMEVMTPFERLIVCDPGDDIGYAMDAMTDKRIRHIPVVDNKGALVGIISVGDVVKALLSDKDYQLKYLKEYIEGKYPV